MRSRTSNIASAGHAFRLAVAGTAIIIMAGCATTQPETAAEEPTVTKPPPAPPTLADSNWRAISIIGKPASSATSTLEFRGTDQVGGNAGCNNFNGSVKLESNSIEFGALATTRKMCAPPINGQETVFLEALSLARKWERDDDNLVLIDDMDSVVAQFLKN